MKKIYFENDRVQLKKVLTIILIVLLIIICAVIVSPIIDIHPVVVVIFLFAMLGYLVTRNLEVICPKCWSINTMTETKREFVEATTLARNVRVVDNKTYRINGGRPNTIQEYRTERQYADVNIYRCTEKCNKCGNVRVIEKMGPR